MSRQFEVSLAVMEVDIKNPSGEYYEMSPEQKELSHLEKDSSVTWLRGNIN